MKGRQIEREEERKREKEREEEMTFQDKQDLKKFIINRSALQEVLKGITQERSI